MAKKMNSAELEKRIEELEKRIAELEEKVFGTITPLSENPPPPPPPPPH